ncbi:hypothetical protein CEJ87_02985 [Caldifermentibacillus hisashii]|nr:hypothetical protein CEJ87_02985 [Caldifermentibacillus hisashii]
MGQIPWKIKQKCLIEQPYGTIQTENEVKMSLEWPNLFLWDKSLGKSCLIERLYGTNLIEK